MKRLMTLVLVLLLPAAALGDAWYTFSDELPQALSFMVYEADYTGSVLLTFLGDCTLGGDDNGGRRTPGFDAVMRSKDVSYPFRGLVRLTEKDDITIANLEGVLTDRNLSRVQKAFNFKGKTAYTEILKAGSVECVGLANNHAMDYGKAGYRDTKAALDAAGIAWFGTDAVTVWKRDGLMIGFIGVHYNLSGDRLTAYRQQIGLLKDMGCSAIITVMHAGNEHTLKITANQKQIASRAAELGSCLVVGHHSHVAQGFELVDGIPVAYSLGNCVFGGAAYPQDLEALALQVKLVFEDGVLVSQELHFYPMQISGRGKRNDYSPVLLTGTAANRVLKMMKESTGYTMPAMGKEGSVITVDMTK